MRIAHVLSSLEFGGQERIALDLAKGQAGRGHQVVTISLAESVGPLQDEFEQHGLEVHSEPKREGGFDFGLWRRLGRFFRERRLDLIHTHNPIPLYYAAVPARLTRAALVHTKHGINPTSSRRLWMRRSFGVLPQRFVCVSESTADVAREQYESLPQRIAVIDNGTDLSRFSSDEAVRREVRDEFGIPADAFVVGTVGRIYPEKAHPFLIESLMDDLDSSFHIVIVGDGPNGDELRAQVREQGIVDRVHLLGIRRDVPRILRAFDIFCLPSLYEGLPVVLPEAMATELPVVATAVGGVPRVIDEGVTGFLIEVGDGEALRERIGRLRASPQRRREMGARGRKVALERYSSDRMVDDYMSLYRQVCCHE